MKRILSILLVLAMLLSMIPAVFAADCDITVSTPAPDPVKVGALYQLPLGTVFTDPNGHALSFALKADYGDKVYIKDNTLQFTSAEAGEFRIGITATCTGGGSTEVTVPITVEAVEDGDKNQYGYDETDQASVTRLCDHLERRRTDHRQGRRRHHPVASGGQGPVLPPVPVRSGRF